MARRNKLLKFTELLTFDNVYENYDPRNPLLVANHDTSVEMSGKWHSEHFKNENPITLELACGRGEYSIALAERYPDRNFIGVDIKGARIWKGAKIAIESKLNNVAFLRTKIEFCHLFFNENEIDEIWITFPDPFLKKGKVNRRLTSPNYLGVYKQFLKPKSPIHLKTDSDVMYFHTKEVIKEEGHITKLDTYDVYGDEEMLHPDLDIKTYYENANISNADSIKYLQFNLKES
ncbi:MAG: tRNA (guanosine(46)-N7)-methyltransferase TrmB [Saprospiraceae bacterium]|nr:tRNA (guanosine(46)-N7)-methyltransferase TrmB [Saprospiraceae bacterium]